MPVFISHSSKDDQFAKFVATALRQKGISVYIDDWDPELRRAPEVTAYLVRQIASCTHLLAIVTEVTRNSWWVPFEVGVAHEGERRIASMLANGDYASLPDFLKIWPVLTTTGQLQSYTDAYLRDSTITTLEKGMIRLSESARTQTADDFHRDLKARLGQR